MNDLQNIDFSDWLVIFNGDILGVSVDSGVISAAGELKRYADCNFPEQAAWAAFDRAGMVCQINIAGMDKFATPLFDSSGICRIPEYWNDVVPSTGELVLLPLDGGSGFTVPGALVDWNFSYRFAGGECACWSLCFLLFADADGVVLKKYDHGSKLPVQREISWHDSAMDLYNIFRSAVALPDGYDWFVPGSLPMPGGAVEIIKESSSRNPLWREFEALITLRFYAVKSLEDTLSQLTGMVPIHDSDMRIELIAAERVKYENPFWIGNVRLRIKARRWD